MPGNILNGSFLELTIVRTLRVAVLPAILSGLILYAPSNALGARIGLAFSHSGDSYIFSDNPESIPSSNGFTVQQTLSSSYTYDIELYHQNFTRSPKRIGVAIHNPNAASATITIYASTLGYIKTGASSEIALTAPLQLAYQMGAGARTLSLPGRDYALLVYLDTPNGQLVNEKVKIKSSLSGVEIRAFHGPTTNFDTPKRVFDYAQQVFGYSRDTAVGGQTAGVFSHDKLSNSTPIDASTYPSFVLSQWHLPGPQNQNEYETATDVLGSPQLGGNFGMVYAITINNPGRKLIRITPNWGHPDNKYARIVLWTQAHGWYSTTPLTPSDKPRYWLMATGTGAAFTFKYVLPGANFGNVTFEVVDSAAGSVKKSDGSEIITPPDVNVGKNANSQATLDQMLKLGMISPDDYKRLSKN